MLHVVGTPLGVLFGLFLFYYFRKSEIVIGKPYTYMDWLGVILEIFVVFVFAMVIEWSAYSAALNTWGKACENNIIIFLMRKGGFVPLFSGGVSILWGWRIRKKYLDYAKGYSLKTAVHCLSIMVAILCLSLQLFFLPGIKEELVYNYIQDNIIAWALMVVGTIFCLGSGCDRRRDNPISFRNSFQGYILPILSAVTIGLFVIVATILNLAPMLFPFLIAFAPTLFVCALISVLCRPSYKRMIGQLKKAIKQGYKSRNVVGEFKGMRFRIEGEWLVIERCDYVKYRGKNEEFDEYFGYCISQ